MVAQERSDALIGFLIGVAALTVDPGWGSCRPADGPTPVLVEGANPGDDVVGVLRLTDARHNRANLPVELAAGGARKRWRLGMPSPATLADARWLSTRGDATVNLITRPACAGAVVTVLERTGGTSVRMPVDPLISAGQLQVEDLDAPWQVLDSIDAVAAEARALSELSDQRFFTLRTWVLEGGLLIVVPGVDPAPLIAEARLPATTDLSSNALSESPWGQGSVVVIPEAAPAADSVMGATLKARVRRSQIERAAARMQRVMLRLSVDSSTGPGAVGGGASLLALGLLVGGLVVGHEFFRRRFVVKAQRLEAYVGFVAGSVALLSLGAFVIARVAARDVRGGSVRLLAQGAAVGRRIAPLSILPGTAMEVEADAFVEADGEVSVDQKRPQHAEAIAGVARTASTVAAWDAGGAVNVTRVPLGFRIDNGTRMNLGPGLIVDGASPNNPAWEVEAIAAGSSTVVKRIAPQKTAPRMAAPFESGGVVLVAPVDDGWLIVPAADR